MTTITPPTKEKDSNLSERKIQVDKVMGKQTRIQEYSNEEEMLGHEM